MALIAPCSNALAKLGNSYCGNKLSSGVEGCLFSYCTMKANLFWLFTVFLVGLTFQQAHRAEVVEKSISDMQFCKKIIRCVIKKGLSA